MNKEVKVKWAKDNHTTWNNESTNAKLCGFSVEVLDFVNTISITAHSTEGVEHGKYFTIPVDKADELCHALQIAKEFCINNKNI